MDYNGFVGYGLRPLQTKGGHAYFAVFVCRDIIQLHIIGAHFETTACLNSLDATFIL